MSKHLFIGLTALIAACGGTVEAVPATPASPAPTSAAVAAAPAPQKPPGTNTVADIAAGSPDHTTLVAALQAAGLVTALGSPGGVYTVFAPTNAAFDKLPPGTVDGLLKPEKKADLKAVLQHHAAVPILQLADIKDGQQLSMADGTTVTFHIVDGKVKVNDANILATVPAMNGIVYVVDTVLLPGT